MGYLDATGTQTLWNNIKTNFGHEIQTSSLSTNGITISLNSGAKTGGNFNQLSTALIPAATNTTGGLVTNAQAQAIASIKTYTAGTGLTLSGNQFSHATGAGYNHIPTGGSSGQILKWSSNGTAQWASEYSYTLPTASADTLGGVKVGDNLTIEDGVLSAFDNDIFVAVYGTTTYDDVLTAFHEGKALLAVKYDSSNLTDNRCYQLSTYDYGNNQFIFECFDGNACYSHQIFCTNSTGDQWDEYTSDTLVTTYDRLANPNALTFTGATTATYDGSSAVSVNIPVSGCVQVLYGQGTYNDVTDYLQNGQIVVAVRVMDDLNRLYYDLVYWDANNTTIWFSCIDENNDTIYYCKCTSEGWTAYDKPTSNIFTATYGSTTYQTIVDKYNAGYQIFMHDEDDNLFVPLSYLYQATSGSEMSFAYFTLPTYKSGGDYYKVYAQIYACDSNNTWLHEGDIELAQKDDIPRALPNPKPLTFTGAATGTYYGSSAVTIDIPENNDNVFIAIHEETTYSEIKAAYDAGKAVLMKVEGTGEFNLLNSISDEKAVFTSVTYGGNKSTDQGSIIFETQCSNANVWTEAMCWLAVTSVSNFFTGENDFENGSITVPTPTANMQATNKQYVDAAIATAISGTAAYGGTVASESELLAKDYKSGMYYVVAVASGSSWSGYENGDMFFAHTDKGTSPSLSDFDCVQTNITAMTDTEINSICTLD